jgi:phage-related protein
LAFDAGAIEASLKVDLSKFDSDMAKAEARADALTKDARKLRVAAEFDDASLSKARKAFTDLDNAISRDAANRLKSGSNGSVLGALNALFSPHQIAGSPSPQQSASQGLLGRMADVTGTSGSTNNSGNQASSLLSSLTSTNTSPTVTQDIRQKLIGGGVPAPGTVTEDVRQKLIGSIAAPGSVTEDVRPVMDRAAEAKLESDMGDAGDKSGKSFTQKFSAHITSMLASLTGGAAGGGGGGSLGSLLADSSGNEESGPAGKLLNSGGIAGGALPGVAGISGFAATITGLGAALVAVLPAITGVVAGLGAIGGGFAILMETDKSFKADVTSTFSGIEKVMGQAAQPLVGPLESALKQLSGFIHQIEPDLKAVFADSAPLIEPLVKGFEELMSGAGPGFLALIKSALPDFQQFGGSLADLGKDLGSMFSDFSKDSGPSATILRSIMDVVGSLLPFIGKLGEILTSAVAPAFADFSKALSSVLPSLTPLLSILGSLAGAVLTDLAGMLTPIASLLSGLAPSFVTLGGVAKTLFTTLENAGVFAILGDSLENIAKPLANLINALVSGVAPALPPLISLVGDLSGVFITLVSAGLGVLISALAKLITFLSPVLPVIVELIGVYKLWTIAQGLLDVAMDTNPIGLFVIAVALLVGAIVELVDHWSTIWGEIKTISDAVWQFLLSDVLDPMENWFTKTAPQMWANTISQLKAIFVTPFETAWRATWSFLQGIGTDFSNFFTKTIPGYFDSLISAVKSRFVTPFENDVKAVYTWLVSNVGTPLLTLFTKTIPGYFTTAVSAVGDAWGKIENIVKAPINWIITNPIDDLIKVFDDISKVVGGPQIPTLKGMAAGGKVTAGTTGTADDVLARLSKGETVVSEQHSRLLAPLFRLLGIPGYSGGGQAGALGITAASSPASSSGILSDVGDVAKALVALATGNSTALGNAITAFVGTGSGSGATGDLAKILTGVPVTLVKDAVTTLLGVGGVSGGNPTLKGAAPPAGSSGGAVEALAKAMAARLGWTGALWNDLDDVEMREAGWNLTAQNPTSDAYGIAQFINGPSEYAQYGGNSTTALGQVTAFLNYVMQRYHGPAGALAHEEEFGWYDQGGWMRGVGINTTGSPEAVLTPAESRAFVAMAGQADGQGGRSLSGQMERMIGVMDSVPARTAGGLHQALNSATAAQVHRSAHRAARHRW